MRSLLHFRKPLSLLAAKLLHFKPSLILVAGIMVERRNKALLALFQNNGIAVAEIQWHEG